MQPFTNHTGVVAPLDRVNVDTDSIVPARFLKRIERTGWGEFLFCDWRYRPDGSSDPHFELNAPEYQAATILVAGRNFGSGSSREHAVWALSQHGFRAVVAPSLADIFHKNCLENGLVPVLLPEEQVNAVMARAQVSPGYRLTVDLERCEVWDDEGFRAAFKVHADPQTHRFRRYCLLNGLDEINLTLHHEDKIAAYERRRWPARFASQS
ncbi:MAG: 3-isopropylmalate dehydratase small subunit [Dehalococcoidia bacterium]